MSKQWRDRDTIIETQTTERVIDLNALNEAITFHQTELDRLTAERDAILDVPGRPQR